jgi:NADH-quinone oxidoreductase subunit N
MTIDLLSPAGALLGLLPEMVLTGWALLVLLVVAWRHHTPEDARLVGWLTLVGIALSGLAGLWLWFQQPVAAGPGGMIALDDWRFASGGLLLGIGFFTVFTSVRFLAKQKLASPEFHVLVLFALIGLLLMVASQDLMLFFLGLEVMSVSVYVLAGFDRYRRTAAEAALKYFLLGAFASCFLLYGIALTWGATGRTQYAQIADALASGQAPQMATLGLGLLLIGFAFKVAAVPFHMWAPDVYEGAPTPVTGFMATAVKAAAFVALGRLLMIAFPALKPTWQPIVGMLAVLTIIVGNVVALAQHSLKRMLAYSSIAHAGYVLAGIWTGSAEGMAAVLVYLGAYCLTTGAAFGILLAVERVGSRTVLIEDLEGLYGVRPWGALAMSVCLFSLLGFPGTFGFIGKWSLVSATLAEQNWLLPLAIVVGSAISIGYYLPVVMAMTLRPTRAREAHRQILFPPAMRSLIAVAAAGILVFGVWPNLVQAIAEAGARALAELPFRGFAAR